MAGLEGKGTLHKTPKEFDDPTQDDSGSTEQGVAHE